MKAKKVSVVELIGTNDASKASEKLDPVQLRTLQLLTDNRDCILAVTKDEEDRSSVGVRASAWEHPGVWGLVLADAARHIAAALAQDGYDYEEVLAELVKVANLEWDGDFASEPNTASLMPLADDTEN